MLKVHVFPERGLLQAVRMVALLVGIAGLELVAHGILVNVIQVHTRVQNVRMEFRLVHNRTIFNFKGVFRKY